MTAKTATDEGARHRAKMAKRKAVQDAEVAGKTIEKGLLIVHTGPGKGKSTAAFGLLLRMLGHGRRSAVVQFIKGAWSTGERVALERFGDLVEWHTMGEGFTWETQDRERDIAACRRAWEKAQELMERSRSVAAGPRRTQHRAALRLSAARRGGGGALRRVVPICTSSSPGATPSRELIEAADLVTEMSLVKHHFAAGVKAQAGIEF